MILSKEMTLEEMQNSFGEEKIYQNHEILIKLQYDFARENEHHRMVYEAWEHRLK